MTILAETPRLFLRPMQADDFDFTFRMQSDPVCMRYIRPPATSTAEVEERLAMWAKYGTENPGLGAFAAIDKASGLPVGNCVVRHIDWQPGNDLEIGYGLLPEHWGRGLATEIAQAICHYALTRFDVPRVLAVTDPDNIASQRVLEKCGFRQIGRRFIYGSENLEFEKVR
ncbi:MAG: GNAT family N-acetyltransferase [Saprospiraceae bacterium]|nr:GNAT family N-acetyltransferase [Saprospiraceae bacterium]